MSVQSMEALATANRVRLARADLKRDISQGKTTAASVITECPWMAETMRVSDVLRAQRLWGAHKTRGFLRELQISESRTVGELTDRQRREVTLYLTPWPVAA
jgi:hypothetical protein